MGRHTRAGFFPCHKHEARHPPGFVILRKSLTETLPHRMGEGRVEALQLKCG
jgi:hypothetical protein